MSRHWAACRFCCGPRATRNHSLRTGAYEEISIVDVAGDPE